MCNAWDRAEIYMPVRCWCKSVNETDHCVKLNIVGRIILKLILKGHKRRMWTQFVWLRIGSIDKTF